MAETKYTAPRRWLPFETHHLTGEASGPVQELDAILADEPSQPPSPQQRAEGCAVEASKLFSHVLNRNRSAEPSEPEMNLMIRLSMSFKSSMIR